MTSAASTAPVLPPPSSKWHRSLPVLAIFALTFLAYAPIYRAGFIWDDDKHVWQNVLLHSTDGLRRLWTVRDALPQYYPLTHTLFWIEYHLWANNPLGYHTVNVLIHALNAVLVWRILKRLDVPGALLAALLFALHPVHVETAAWISERKNTLSGLFYLLSLSCYLRLPSIRWYFAALILFVCALLSKTVTSTLPAVVLLLIWWRVGRIRWRDVWPLLPFFALGLIAGANTAWLERTHVGAQGPEWRFGATIPREIAARILIAGRDVWFYLAKLLLPYPLMFEYPRWHIHVGELWQFLFPAAVVGLVIALLLLRCRIGRGPATAFLFFIGTLLPALGLTNIYPMRFSFVADHFQYLASIGPLSLAAAGIHRLTHRRSGIAIPPELLIGALGMLTFLRASVFESEKSLYADSISKNPAGWLSQSNYGALLANENHLDEGESHLLASLRLHPDNPVAMLHLGDIAEKRGDFLTALHFDRKAADLNRAMPEPHVAIADTLEKLGDIDGAVEEYTAAVRLQPENAVMRQEFGKLLYKHDRFAEAVVQFDHVLQLMPDSAQARRDRLAALERAGDYDRAAGELHALLATHPDATLYSDLGLVELARHHEAQAIAAFTECLKLNPDQPQALRS